MGSYLGTIFALPDSLFARAVPAATASAAALSEAAVPPAADSAAADLSADASQPSQQDASNGGTVDASEAIVRDDAVARQQQPDDAQPLPEASQPGVTCRACDIGMHIASTTCHNSTTRECAVMPAHGMMSFLLLCSRSGLQCIRCTTAGTFTRTVAILAILQGQGHQ